MRLIDFETVAGKVCELCREAAFALPEDALLALKRAEASETSATGKSILSSCLENAHIAESELVPLCQDTGTAVFWILMGSETAISGGPLSEAVNAGVRRGYTENFLRKSIVSDPLYSRV